MNKQYQTNSDLHIYKEEAVCTFTESRHFFFKLFSGERQLTLWDLFQTKLTNK